MGKINVLGFDVANLIAAGEVVDRPASVLKELLENAIDAGADSITAEIRSGGVAMIRVSDNGCGMTAEDLPIAIRRHATSKIRTAEDLDSIATLGFRGEALAAIAAVADIRILTKTKEAVAGTILTAENGRVTDISEVGCADGTTVVVENLFANFPARRKFLKKDSTETTAAVAILEKVAMSRPDISFTLITDGNTRYTTAGDGKLKNTLYALLGREFATRLIEVEGSVNGMRVTGYIGTPDNARNNRNHQNVFINGRYVKSKTVTAAVEKAYTSYMAPERFPVCAVFLEIPSTSVDVNVHPAKLEVKFSDERAIFELVYYALRSALEENVSRPELDLSRITPRTSPKESTPTGEQMRATFAPPTATPSPRYPSVSATPLSPRRTSVAPQGSVSEALRRMREGMDDSGLRDPMTAPASESRGFSAPASFDTVADAEKYTPIRSSVYSAVATDKAPLPSEPPKTEDAAPAKTEAIDTPVNERAVMPEYRIIGEAFRCYVIVEFEKELLLIDKHAAHERILFEELLARQKSDGRVASQSLLVPIPVSLTESELAVAQEYRADYEAVGFTFTVDNEKPGVLLNAVPDAIAADDAESLFARMTGELLEGEGNPMITEAKRREKTLYQIACKAAIKAGRHYGEEQIAWLVARLLALPDITVCPHGRPVAIRMTKNSLDRQFDRIM